jgi:hypothetical protein
LFFIGILRKSLIFAESYITKDINNAIRNNKLGDKALEKLIQNDREMNDERDVLMQK